MLACHSPPVTPHHSLPTHSRLLEKLKDNLQEKREGARGSHCVRCGQISRVHDDPQYLAKVKVTGSEEQQIHRAVAIPKYEKIKEEQMAKGFKKVKLDRKVWGLECRTKVGAEKQSGSGQVRKLGVLWVHEAFIERPPVDNGVVLKWPEDEDELTTIRHNGELFTGWVLNSIFGNALNVQSYGFCFYNFEF